MFQKPASKEAVATVMARNNGGISECGDMWLGGLKRDIEIIIDGT